MIGRADLKVRLYARRRRGRVERPNDSNDPNDPNDPNDLFPQSERRHYVAGVDDHVLLPVD